MREGWGRVRSTLAEALYIEKLAWLFDLQAPQVCWYLREVRDRLLAAASQVA